jgi:tetratricopeptide (TPR) repeat protein
LIRDETRAKALHALGILIYRHTNYAGDCWTVARARLNESLGIYRRLGDEPRVATVLQELGPIVAELGDLVAARTFLDESLEIGRRSGHEPGIARSLIYLGVSCLTAGDHTSARAYLEESLEIFRRLDDRFWINACLVHLGFVDCEEGDHAAARSAVHGDDRSSSLLRFPLGRYVLVGGLRPPGPRPKVRRPRALRLGGADGRAAPNLRAWR